MDWTPDLAAEKGPMYLKIANAITADIRSGDLAAGSALPPQRDLAFRLGVTVGTVTRAYQEAARLGVLESDGRRGTRIKGTHVPALATTGPKGRETHELRGHAAVQPDWGAQLRQAIMGVALDQSHDDASAYDTGPGNVRYREAGARWMQTVSGHPADPERMVVTNGAQHALFCVLLMLSRPGELVATEQLTYVGLKSSAAQLGLQLVPVDIDAFGLVPESFEEVCRENKIKLLVTVPDNHNPTTVTQPLKRRQQIADIAARHGVFIVEDTVYTGLSSDAVPPYAALAKDITFRLTGLSKTLGPGLRTGFVEAPDNTVSGLIAAIRATTWMASPLQSEMAVQLIDSGEADNVLRRNRTEYGRRNDAFQKLLSGLDISDTRSSPHAWLKMPRSWSREQFQTWSIENNILTLGSEVFSLGPGPAEDAVRLSLTAAPTLTDLESALHLIAKALKNSAPDAGAHA